MTSLSDTIKRLAEQQAGHFGNSGQTSRLGDLGDFGPNPGRLAAKIYVPSPQEQAPALVVVLHGCTQSAAAYDNGSGWSRLADEHGFILLFPEQRRENNANLCFNWFSPGDIRRGEGEAFSVSQMIDIVCRQHEVDPKRVFITGLSAGGAMANVMLATYPEVFAGGAIIAGLPYDVASTVPEALERMRGYDLPPAALLSAKIVEASPHEGPWPLVSIWQGTEDHTVAEANAQGLVEQWRSVHGVASSSPKSSSSEGNHRITRWEMEDGFAPIEFHSIDGMGHGTPIDTQSGLGIAAPFMLDVGVSSTAHIARSWGLTPSFGRRSHPEAGQNDILPERPKLAPADGIQAIIENALRSAGLMR
ncbi:PHB depolymerase family esterase (plasmid) [Rhizobium lusitanum]|uniref:extracellular catalytic domain type 1 short-chain-length polyhydroxyalkanoate depolymerase n=1 Tax=Rhizobium lusitanum TaxID=293958 RepID=UPI0016122374|nr:PHB depolymerase family esterase [Rhizobium lusitanum]QND46057.1 PHB depolymerase family esterase [Rhizobium lusitanum]